MRVAMVTRPCGPSPLLLWLVQLLLWFHHYGLQVAAASAQCPPPCTCSNQASRVICTRKTLELVPESISENTRYLNLQENSIQVGYPINQVTCCMAHVLCCTCTMYSYVSQRNRIYSQNI